MGPHSHCPSTSIQAALYVRLQNQPLRIGQQLGNQVARTGATVNLFHAGRCLGATQARTARVVQRFLGVAASRVGAKPCRSTRTVQRCRDGLLLCRHAPYVASRSMLDRAA